MISPPFPRYTIASLRQVGVVSSLMPLLDMDMSTSGELVLACSLETGADTNTHKHTSTLRSKSLPLWSLRWPIFHPGATRGAFFRIQGTEDDLSLTHLGPWWCRLDRADLTRRVSLGCFGESQPRDSKTDLRLSLDPVYID